VHALPFLFALAAAVTLAPVVLRALTDGVHTRVNYRDRPLPYPFGVLSVAAALLALIPLALLQEIAHADVFHSEVYRASIYVLGVALLGLIDDLLASERAGRVGPRGWRGHGAALAAGRPSTGALKAGGSLGLALFVAASAHPSLGRCLLAAAVLVLATNVFNLLDLRPGRSTKAFVLLGAGLTIGSGELRPLWVLGLFVAPALVAGVYDLRERAMIGDTGANLLGALAGLWLVLTLSTIGQAVALGLLAVITIYGEFRSISGFLTRTPLLRELDSWGRPS
jgi:UDP-GlcNAc:undecaprenyl-phosphate/decaprenyl-phosphate GlcNAc-1-phosphate transferase